MSPVAAFGAVNQQTSHVFATMILIGGNGFAFSFFRAVDRANADVRQAGLMGNTVARTSNRSQSRSDWSILLQVGQTAV